VYTFAKEGRNVVTAKAPNLWRAAVISPRSRTGEVQLAFPSVRTFAMMDDE